PACQTMQCIAKSGNKLIGDLDTRLHVQRLDLEGALPAMGFGVEASDEGVAVQDRQREVTVAPPECRRVALDAVVEAEELEGASAVPDYRVEGRKHCRRAEVTPVLEGFVYQRDVSWKHKSRPGPGVHFQF